MKVHPLPRHHAHHSEHGSKVKKGEPKNQVVTEKVTKTAQSILLSPLTLIHNIAAMSVDALKATALFGVSVATGTASKVKNTIQALFSAMFSTARSITNAIQTKALSPAYSTSKKVAYAVCVALPVAVYTHTVGALAKWTYNRCLSPALTKTAAIISGIRSAISSTAQAVAKIEYRKNIAQGTYAVYSVVTSPVIYVAVGTKNIFFVRIPHAVYGAGQAVGNRVISVLSAVYGAIAGAVKKTTHGVVSAAQLTANSVMSVVRLITNGVTSAAQSTAHGVTSVVRSTTHTVASAVQSTAHGVTSVVQSTTNGVASAVQSTARGVMSVIQLTTNGVASAVRSTALRVMSVVQLTANGVGFAVQSTAHGVVSAVQLTANGVVSIGQLTAHGIVSIGQFANEKIRKPAVHGVSAAVSTLFAYTVAPVVNTQIAIAKWTYNRVLSPTAQKIAGVACAVVSTTNRVIVTPLLGVAEHVQNVTMSRLFPAKASTKAAGI